MTRRRKPGDRSLDPGLFDLPLEAPRRLEPAPTPAPNSARSEPLFAAAPPVSQEPLDSTTECVVATLGPRLLSAGADLLVHAGALAASTLGLHALAIEPRLDHWPPLLAFMLAFSFLYTVVSLAFWGQTAGMAWFGLTARESPQFPLSFTQACIRWLGGLLTLSLAGLPLLLALGGRSLSDRLSRSKTFRGF